MSLPRERKISIDEFYKMRENTTNLLEYVDGLVLMSPSPSTKHQRVSARLQATLFTFLKESECEVFSAPYDIQLQRDDLGETTIFIPDLSIICDKEGLEENRYIGVPTLIIEILSPSNQNFDLVTKMDAYMRFGVKEYWVINPMLNAVQIYNLNKEGNYQQTDILRETGIIKSQEFTGLQVDLEDIF